MTRRSLQKALCAAFVALLVLAACGDPEPVADDEAEPSFTTDTDKDGFSDGLEAREESNPNDKDSVPTGVTADFPENVAAPTDDCEVDPTGEDCQECADNPDAAGCPDSAGGGDCVLANFATTCEPIELSDAPGDACTLHGPEEEIASLFDPEPPSVQVQGGTAAEHAGKKVKLFYKFPDGDIRESSEATIGDDGSFSVFVPLKRIGETGTFDHAELDGQSLDSSAVTGLTEFTVAQATGEGNCEGDSAQN